MWSQTGDMGGQRRSRTLADFFKALDQLLGCGRIVETLRRPHVVVVETVQVMTAVKYDERVVDMLCTVQGFANGAGVAELADEFKQARLLGRLADGLSPADADRYLVRDAQRVIESIEALVRIHNAQEEDIYEHAAAA